jgi:EAL domain-containing protein (putative c-di-GMP-specific phosphodiesterase class I)
MIQILSGIENGEFSVFYEPVCKIEDRSIEKAIGKIRWNHKTLGIIDLVSYESVIKANGFIIKLEKFVWENVAEHLSKLKEQSLRTVPVVLRASKQLVLSTDISQYISDLTQKYCLMPRDIEIAIEWNAYRDCYEMAKKSETSLLELGYNVIIDNFSGSSLQLPNTNAEEIIVDFKEIDENEFESFATQIGRKNINIIPTSVSFAKQITVIRKCGCKFACGSHLCPQISANDFTNMINQ